MSEEIDKIQVLERIKGYYGLKTNAKFASFLEIAPTTLSSWYSRSTFDLDVIYSKCAGLSMNWVLTGYGPMLLNDSDSKNSEETKLGCTPNATPISPAEESIIYKMYKDEKEEKERMLKEKEVSLKEKESKIDHLQSELRSMEKELAVLKALHSQSQDKEPEHHSNVDKALELFSLEPSEASIKGYSPTSPPAISKKLSAGKI